MNKELQKFKKEVRRALADYIASEGCSCCQDTEAHKKAMNRLGEILSMKKYDDDSGYDYSKYKTKK